MQEILHGNNIELLKTFPDNHFDSIVTDPPYGLNFMGKKWDYQVPTVEFWKEALRVLKPGGHVLSFCGTRTYHRMVVNIEDAGFEIRDCIQWIYGCLSEDTEILTENGWEGYRHIRKSKNTRILAYNLITDSYEFEVPERWSEYNIKDTVYRIQSDNTNQIVSRNHRCIIEREGVLLFEVAENLSQKTKTCIPFLENLPILQSDISNLYQRASIKEQKLLKDLQQQTNGICKQPGWQNNIKKKDKNIRGKKINNGKLFCLWKRNNKTNLSSKKFAKSLLFKKMQWENKGNRMGETRIQGAFTLVEGSKGSLDKKNDRRNKSIMERRYNLSEQKGILQPSKNKVPEMSKAIYSNVEERWIHNGISPNNGNANRKMPVENGMCSPYRSQPNEQRNNKSNAICNEQRPQKIRGGKSYNTTMATITPVDYSGIVFCPTVSTGAFVARRNGKIFITGNSGFPKCLNVSKGIDAKLGAERRVTGINTNGSGASNIKLQNHSKGDTGIGMLDGSEKAFEITEHSSDQAKQWDGWGTALKPANEPICIARKPISENTIADNVLKHGAGGINIDGCRIGYESTEEFDKLQQGRKSNRSIREGNVAKGFGMTPEGLINSEQNKLGRFPANIIFDEEAAKVLDEQTGILTSGKPIGNKSAVNNIYGKYGTGVPVTGFGDSGGASRFFYVAKASQGERNYGLTGFEEKQQDVSRNEGDVGGNNPRNRGVNKTQNFHPTVKPISLMRYLVRLVTPPNGICLDPFCGSGTTGIACKLEDFNFVGMEMDEDYCAIARARIVSWTKDTDVYEQSKKEPIIPNQQSLFP